MLLRLGRGKGPSFVHPLLSIFQRVEVDFYTFIKCGKHGNDVLRLYPYKAAEIRLMQALSESLLRWKQFGLSVRQCCKRRI